MKEPAHYEPKGPNERFIDYLTYMPEYFVGKTVFRRWKDVQTVFRRCSDGGTILEYDVEKVKGAIPDKGQILFAPSSTLRLSSASRSLDPSQRWERPELAGAGAGDGAGDS